jgi:hypothetical protein
VLIGLNRWDAIAGVIRFGNRVRSRVNWVEQKGCDRTVIRFGNRVRSRSNSVEQMGCDRGVIIFGNRVRSRVN